MQWNSKLCKVRKDRKQPKYKKQRKLQCNNYKGRLECSPLPAFCFTFFQTVQDSIRNQFAL
jgi:hypothetical protein